MDIGVMMGFGESLGYPGFLGRDWELGLAQSVSW